MSLTVLITGGSSGIGLAASRHMLARGYRLLWVSLDAAEIEAARTQLMQTYPTAQIEGLALDLAEPQSVDRIVQWAEGQGGIDVLINNAGFGVYGFSADLPVAQERAMVDVNIKALHGLTRAFLPRLEPRAGTIIHVASNSALVPTPGLAVYAATKAFVRHYSNALNEELREAGSPVRVLTLCPAAVSDTPFKARANMDRVRTFSSFTATTADEVARDLLHLLDTGQRERFSGAAMRRALWLFHVLPRPVLRWMTRRETQTL